MFAIGCGLFLNNSNTKTTKMSGIIKNSVLKDKLVWKDITEAMKKLKPPIVPTFL